MGFYTILHPIYKWLNTHNCRCGHLSPPRTGADMRGPPRTALWHPPRAWSAATSCGPPVAAGRRPADGVWQMDGWIELDSIWTMSMACISVVNMYILYLYIYMCVDQNMCQDVKYLDGIRYTIDFRRYSGLPKHDRIRIVWQPCSLKHIQTHQHHVLLKVILNPCVQLAGYKNMYLIVWYCV